MTAPTMRAKLQVASIKEYRNTEGAVSQEDLTFNGVAKSSAYPADGSDEDNSFARWSPSIRLDISIQNPALFGQFKVGDKFYADFTKAE